jgi:GNAT superfamily N-acetyltransferase
VTDVPISIRAAAGNAGDVCRRVLAELPQWFGIAEAVEGYVKAADAHESLIAAIGGEDVGITTVVRHSPFAAEIHLMAVVPALHRRGVGTAMLRHAEAGIAAGGVEFLQVKTLSDSHPDAGYAKTRAFYLDYGFRPLEEFPTLWDPSNPALQMIKVVTRRPGRDAAGVRGEGRNLGWHP